MSRRSSAGFRRLRRAPRRRRRGATRSRGARARSRRGARRARPRRARRGRSRATGWTTSSPPGRGNARPNSTGAPAARSETIVSRTRCVTALSLRLPSASIAVAKSGTGVAGTTRPIRAINSCASASTSGRRSSFGRIQIGRSTKYLEQDRLADLHGRVPVLVAVRLRRDAETERQQESREPQHDVRERRELLRERRRPAAHPEEALVLEHAIEVEPDRNECEHGVRPHALEPDDVVEEARLRGTEHGRCARAFPR